MKKVLFVLLLVLLSGIQLYSQITFERNYGGNSNDYGTSAIQTTDGGYIISGISYDGAAICKSYLIKTNEFGDTIWTKKIEGDNIISWANSVIQTADGGYIFTGVNDAIPAADILLVKTNSIGDTLWRKIFGGIYDDEGKSVIQTFDRGYILTGGTEIYNGSSFYLIKTDSCGNMVWSKTYGGYFFGTGYSVVQTSDSGYVIAGSISGPGNVGKNLYIVRTNYIGDTLWTRTYGGNNYTEGYSLKITNDSGFIIVGTLSISGPFLNNQVYLLRTNANGDSLWSKTFGGIINNDYGNSVAITNDGGFIIAGYSINTSVTNGDAFIIKTNANGDSLWSKSFGGDSLDLVSSVNITNDNGFIIAGSTISFGLINFNAYLIKTDADGIITGIKDYTKKADNISIYPNPFSQSSQITLNQNYHSIALAVYDSQGKQVTQQQYADCDKIQFSRNQLSNGLYFLKLTLDDKAVETGKIVISEE